MKEMLIQLSLMNILAIQLPLILKIIIILIALAVLCFSGYFIYKKISSNIVSNIVDAEDITGIFYIVNNNPECSIYENIEEHKSVSVIQINQNTFMLVIN